MTGATYALLERLHDHLALLGLAVLIHPLLTLRARAGLSRRTLLTADLGALLLLLPYVGGWLLYPTYRARVKPGLLRQDLPLALRFETKEHLAVMTVALALGAAVALHAAGRTPQGRTAAWWMLLLAAGCGLATAALGLWVSAGATPAW